MTAYVDPLGVRTHDAGRGRAAENANFTMINERWFDVLVREFRTLEAQKGTHQVRVSCDFGRGTVWFRDGRLLDAEMGLFGGADAVFRLLGAKGGELEVVPGAMPRSRTIYLTVDELLVQHARRVSQGRDLANRLPALDTVPAVNAGVLERLRSALDGSEQRLLALVDQRRTLREILDQNGLGQEAAFAQLGEYFAVGLLVPHATKLGAESRGRDTRRDPRAGITPRVPTLIGPPEPARPAEPAQSKQSGVLVAQTPPPAPMPFAQTLQVEVPPAEPREKPPLVSVAKPVVAVSSGLPDESPAPAPSTLRMPVPIPEPAARRVLRRVTQAGPFTETMPLVSPSPEQGGPHEPAHVPDDIRGSLPVESNASAVTDNKVAAATDSVVSTARGLALAAPPLEPSRAFAVTQAALATEAPLSVTAGASAFQGTLPGGLIAPAPEAARLPAPAVPSDPSDRGEPRWSPLAPGTAVGRHEVLLYLSGGPAKARYLARTNAPRANRTPLSLTLLPIAGDVPSTAALAKATAELAAVHHPNLVGFVDAGVDKQHLYVAADYVEGCTLAHLLEKATTRPPRLLVSILLDALMGLHAVHTARTESGGPLALVHGHLSPNNVLVSVNGTARIQNLIHPLLTRASALAEGEGPTRALAYRAPEKLQGDPPDRRSDVFSIGVVLWNTLTGEDLFLGGADQETIKNVLEKEVPLPSTQGIRPPACFDAICTKALDRDPDRRFQWAEEMLTHLGRVALQQGLLASKREVAEWVLNTVGDEIQRERQIILDGAKDAGATNRESPVPPAGRNSSYDLRADLKKGAADRRQSSRRWAVGLGLTLALALTVGAGIVAPRKFGYRFGYPPASPSESISAALPEQNVGPVDGPIPERAAGVESGASPNLGVALSHSSSAAAASDASPATSASTASPSEKKGTPPRVVGARPRRAPPHLPANGKIKNRKPTVESSALEQPPGAEAPGAADTPSAERSPGVDHEGGADLPNAGAPPSEPGSPSTPTETDRGDQSEPKLETKL